MSMKERKKVKGVIPFSLGTAGTATSYLIVAQLTYCLTDSYGMSAIAVGTIIMLSRIFDGLSDIVAGFIIDKTHTRFGKARPFDLFTILMWICLLLSFNVPAFQNIGKIVWVFLTYNLCQTVFFTFATVAQPVRIKRSFDSENQPKVLSVAALVSTLVSVVAATALPVLIKTFESRPFGWTIIISCFAIPAIITTLFMFFMVPEMETATEETKNMQNKISLKDAVSALIKNKYLFLVAVVIIGQNAIVATSSSAGVYYFKYIMGDISLMSIMSLFGIIGSIMVAFMPMLVKRSGKRGVVILGGVLVLVGHMLKIIMGRNIAWITVCNIISGSGLVLVTSVQNLLIIDCMEYGKLITHKEYEGVYSSVMGVAAKISQGLGAVIIGLILNLGHYDGLSETQSASAITAVQFNFIWLPALLGIMLIVPMLFYNLDKKINELKAQQNLDNGQ